MGFAKKIRVSGVIHAGDWNTPESVETVLSFGIPLYAVLGNADIDPAIGKRLKLKGKGFAENYLEFEVGGRKIGVTHKPSDNKKYFFCKKYDVILNGHLHSKYESVRESTKFIRPGATVSGINFAIYDTVINGVEFVRDE